LDQFGAAQPSQAMENGIAIGFAGRIESSVTNCEY
jgi:hypothetical protein